jgi:hypothetical protein
MSKINLNIIKHYKYNTILYIMIVKQIKDLPDEIIRLIFEYIPEVDLIFTNTTNYKLYHHLIKHKIKLYESYIRDVIKRDNEFVFNQILIDNVDKFIKSTNYIYKNMTFSNYIYFIKYFCMEHDSDNCRKLLVEELIKRDLHKNLHKKNVIKYNI